MKKGSSAITDCDAWMLESNTHALQIEEAYIGADQFCSLVRQDSQTVLRNELNVLHGLRFDLVTHPPLRSLQGFFQASLLASSFKPDSLQYA